MSSVLELNSMMDVINDLKDLCDGVERERKEVEIDSITISDFKKSLREDTMHGLENMINALGVVNDVHVMALEDEDEYLLLDGLRRLYTLAEQGETMIDVVVWNFEDKERAKEKANLISLFLNRTQSFSNKEIWNAIKEIDENLDSEFVEYILELESGEYTKIKDIMLDDIEGSGKIRQKYIEGKLDTEKAYKKIVSAHKKEAKRKQLEEEFGEIAVNDFDGADNFMGIENEEGFSDINDFANVELENEVEGVDHTQIDSGEYEFDNETELKNVLNEEKFEELLNVNSEAADISSLDRSDDVREVKYQDTKHREHIDSDIKKQVLVRDDFKCRCCGEGGKENPYMLSILVYHHLIPVFCGGADTVENGISLCVNCHLLLHLYIFGKLFIDKEEFESMEEAKKEKIKNILKYGNIAIEAMNTSKIDKKKAYKLDENSRKHLNPKDITSENIEIFEEHYKNNF